MKSFLFIAVCSLLGMSQYAIGASTLRCPIGGWNNYGLAVGGWQSRELFLAMATANELDCTREDEDGNQTPYYVRFASGGPGLKIATSEIRIYCSGEQPDGFYIQAGFSCDVGIGCQVRIAKNANQSCLVVGFEVGVGAEISLGKLEIWNSANQKARPGYNSPEEIQY